MTWLVVYDIEKDNIRERVADYCLDKGLTRIQYSCFLGEMVDAVATDLEALCRKKLGDAAGEVRFVPICEKDMKRQRIIGEAWTKGK
jgi:CRISPR-associated protein Cas2